MNNFYYFIFPMFIIFLIILIIFSFWRRRSNLEFLSLPEKIPMNFNVISEEKQEEEEMKSIENSNNSSLKDMGEYQFYKGV